MGNGQKKRGLRRRRFIVLALACILAKAITWSIGDTVPYIGYRANVCTHASRVSKKIIGG